MLIDFEVGNYLSFGKPVRLSMVAANSIKEHEENVFDAGRYRLLKSAAIYGANASGKSNLLNALSRMRWLVLNSSKEMQVGEHIRVIPFKLDAEMDKSPSRFEIIFLINEIKYRYGFEVNSEAVSSEWLFSSEKNKETSLFLRQADGIDVKDDFSEGRELESKTRDNALFLSVVAQFNGEISKKILNWFATFKTLHGLQEERYARFTAQTLEDEILKNQLVNFIRKADLGIEDLSVVELDVDEQFVNNFQGDIQNRFKSVKKLKKVMSMHPRFNNGEKIGSVTFNFFDEESEGTKKFFLMAGPILDCLKNGYTVTVDELDAKMHPLLTRAIIRLFNSKETNPNNAQLIFAVHDTNLLNYGNLRRDQIWFVEKNQQSATDLYSLAEFKLPDGTKVRNDAALEKNYIQGRYGAIPYLGNFEELFKENEGGAQG